MLVFMALGGEPCCCIQESSWYK